MHIYKENSRKGRERETHVLSAKISQQCPAKYAWPTIHQSERSMTNGRLLSLANRHSCKQVAAFLGQPCGPPNDGLGYNIHTLYIPPPHLHKFTLCMFDQLWLPSYTHTYT